MNIFKDLPITKEAAYDEIKDELIIPATHDSEDFGVALTWLFSTSTPVDNLLIPGYVINNIVFFKPNPDDLVEIWKTHLENHNVYIRPDVLTIAVVRAVNETFENMIEDCSSYSEQEYRVKFDVDKWITKTIQRFRNRESELAERELASKEVNNALDN